MRTLLFVSMLTAVVPLVVASVRERQVPASISAMVYLLPKGGWQWLWTLWLWAVAFTLAPPLIEAMPDGWRFIAALMLASLSFTAAMPLFDQENKKLHYRFAIASGVLSQLCVLILNPLWLLSWLPMLALIVSAFAAHNDEDGIPKVCNGKGVFIAEVACVLLLYAALLFE